MSKSDKNDRLRELREAKFSRRKVVPAVLPALKPVAKKNPGRAHKNVVKPSPAVERAGREFAEALQKRVDKQAPPSHPDCLRCRANREATAERMQKLRKARAKR